jgi:transposase
MTKSVRYVGLDVHAESIIMAVADAGEAPAQVWKSIPYDLRRLLKELERLGSNSRLKVCYEAGPTGFGVQRFLERNAVECVVVAPSLVPVQSGSRVKTDRRDARKLAHFLRSGDLTPIWVPDEQTEALRDLERAREDARLAERRARQQLLKFLLRHDRRFTEGKSHWTQMHWRWVLQQQFSHEALNRVLADYVQAAQQATERVQRLTRDIAELVEGWSLGPLVKNLQAFHGVQLVTAVGLAAEIGNFERFEKAGQFMAFVGLVPSEHSSGGSRKQGGITKTGNRHVRRLLVEAAWHYSAAPPGSSAALQKRREGVPPEIVAIAEKARLRLRRKAYRMRAAKKLPNKIATALARELAGFLWAAARATSCPASTIPKEPPSAPVAQRRGRSNRRLRDELKVSSASAAPAARGRLLRQ